MQQSATLWNTKLIWCGLENIWQLHWHLPNKRDTFDQCRFNVGPASQTLAQQSNDIESCDIWWLHRDHYQSVSHSWHSRKLCSLFLLMAGTQWSFFWYPKRQEKETSAPRWFNVSPASQAVVHNWTSITENDFCFVWAWCFVPQVEKIIKFGS